MLCDNCVGHMAVHPKGKLCVLGWMLLLCHTVAMTDEHASVQLKGQNRTCIGVIAGQDNGNTARGGAEGGCLGVG